MNNLPFPCPDPNHSLNIDWASFQADWINSLAKCPQDPQHHGEGDVWTHTKMVCEALVALPEWQALPTSARELVFAGALLHDVAKPICTKIEEDGRIRQPGHSPKGAVMARELLWRMGVPFTFREQITALIRTHQIPFFLIDEQDSLRRLAHISQFVNCCHLALLAQADALGRICQDMQKLLDNIGLFRELCKEHDCYEQAWTFPSDHARFQFFRNPQRDPSYDPFDDTRCEVILMSGLPGAGKDTWIHRNLDLPVLSLDAIRQTLKISPNAAQGAVIAKAYEQAREYLRTGQSFVWNATNLSREIRQRKIDLFAAYHARVRLVYIEVPYQQLFRQNRQREHAVPEAVLLRMLRIWEVPDRSEAHLVNWYST